MKILVINGGSSSIKVQLFDMSDESVIYHDNKEEVVDYDASLAQIFKDLIDKNILKDISDIDMFAHRVVHGGSKYSKAAIIDDKVIEDIRYLSSLAPLHNPVNLKAIEYIKSNYLGKKQVGVFDTAFHQSIPSVAYTYALPLKLRDKHHVRRYGFHGTSHKYLSIKASKELNIPLNKINLITIHLGNGASITAIKNGKSIDTSMGFTPLEGLVMGTRAGDMDSAIIFWLHDNLGMSYNDINTMLNKQSGLKGITSQSNMREIEKLYKQDDKMAKLAIDMFVYRVQKYIGSYKEILPSLDAIVFSGGIGENSTLIRELILSNNKNKDAEILVIKTDEELQIAREAMML